MLFLKTSETTDCMDGFGGHDCGEGANSLLLQVCSFLGATVMINTFIYKAPQMYAIIHSGSSQGVSLSSVILEWIAYTIMLTYQSAMGFPFETYMENTLMVFHDFMLLAVILHNRHMLNPGLILWFALYASVFTIYAMRWFPDTVMVAFIGSTTPILCWSKVDQLYEILVTGNPGSVSALTWFISVYNTGVRILTTVVITQDIPMLVNLTSSEVLNIAIFVSVIYYNRMKAKRRRGRRV